MKYVSRSPPKMLKSNNSRQSLNNSNSDFPHNHSNLLSEVDLRKSVPNAITEYGVTPDRGSEVRVSYLNKQDAANYFSKV